MKITRDRIPEDVLKEIFPRGLKRGLASERMYSQLKQMILSGKVKKGGRLVQEKIAQRFDVSRMIISKHGVGSFVVRLLKILRFANSFRDLCLPIF